jgi:hypothetical protein
MGGSMAFINLLRDHPLVGLLIGLGFFIIMFGSKNLIVYFYAKSKEKEKQKDKDSNSDSN